MRPYLLPQPPVASSAPVALPQPWHQWPRCSRCCRQCVIPSHSSQRRPPAHQSRACTRGCAAVPPAWKLQNTTQQARLCCSSQLAHLHHFSLHLRPLRVIQCAPHVAVAHVLRSRVHERQARGPRQHQEPVRAGERAHHLFQAGPEGWREAPVVGARPLQRHTLLNEPQHLRGACVACGMQGRAAACGVQGGRAEARAPHKPKHRDRPHLRAARAPVASPRAAWTLRAGRAGAWWGAWARHVKVQGACCMVLWARSWDLHRP